MKKRIYSIRAGDCLVHTMMNEEVQAAILSNASSMASISVNMGLRISDGSMLSGT